MGAIKRSVKADAAGYLYRSAFYLAKGDEISGLFFLKKSLEKNPLNKDCELNKLIVNPKVLNNSRIKKYWAEKILDWYQKYTLHNL